MTPARLFVLTTLLAPALSCGSAKPSEPAHGRPVAPLAPAGPEALTPVATPPEVFAVARLGAPARLVDAAAGWVGFPFDWRTLLAKEVPGADRVVVIDAPIDAAVLLDPGSTMEPRVLGAFSIGVTSVDEALAFFKGRGELVRKKKSWVRLGEFTCAVERSLGPSPARLICGDDDEAVEALAPYMTRGLPTESFGTADLHAHIDAEPLRRRFGAQLSLLKTAGVPFVIRELALDHPPFDAALRDVLYGGADEVIDVLHDVARFSVDASIDTKREQIDVTASASLVGQKSWSSKALVSASAEAREAPELFWKVPADATSASYTAASDPARLEKPVTLLANLAAGWLDHVGLPEKQRNDLVTALKKLFLTRGGSVYAELPLAPFTRQQLSESERAAEAMKRAIGQYLFVVENDKGELKATLNAVMAALANRSFRAALEKKGIVPRGALPVLRSRPLKRVKDVSRDAAVYELDVPLDAIMSASTGAPGGTPAAGKAKRAPKAPPLRVLVVVVPDGARTWMLLGTDEAALKERLSAVRAGTGEILEKREGLSPLRAQRVNSGGFATIKGIVDELASPFENLERLAETYDGILAIHRVLAAMPHGGQTPILYSMTAGADGPTATFRLTVPKAVVQDVAAGAAAGLSRFLDP